MLNRGTESSAATSGEEQSSEEDSEEESDVPSKDENEKEQVTSLDLNTTKAEERRSVTMIPPKVK